MLPTHKRLVVTGDGPETQLVVACPHQIEPAPISECADCDLCQGLDLEGVVSVRCAVAPTTPAPMPPAGGAISTLMASPVITVPADTAIENVRWMMLDRNIGAVPVVDDRGRPIGIVAKTDLLRDHDGPSPTVLEAEPAHRDPSLSPLELSGLRASDVMTPVVRAVLEDSSIAAAASVLASERIHHLLVLDELGRLVGLVSALDIVRWVAATERFAPRTALRRSARG